MSTFSGLNTALTSLYAQRRALDVTGQNIANVNTDGYTRQRVDLQSIGGNTLPAIFSTSPGVGGGVSSDTVTRIRDMFLESRAHTEHSNGSRLTEEANALTQIEQAMREPGKAGLQSALSEMWAGWGDVANQPHDASARTQLLQQVKNVASSLQTSRGALDQQWTDTHTSLAVLVDDVNGTSAAIAELNQSIQRATQSGIPANELADKRDLMVLQLADKIGATTRQGDDGMMNVFVGGTPLVFGSSSTPLKIAGATQPDDAAASPPRFETAAGNFTVSVGGTAQGKLNALTTIIPAYRNGLDQTAATLAANLNSGQAAGYDLNGGVGAALVSTGGAPGPITAANFTVAITDPRGIAASRVPSPPPPAAPVFDGSNADAMSMAQFSPEGATAGYRQLIVGLGVQSQGVQRSLDIQQVITTQVDAARESTAGVNIDEEMTNMLSFQHAYQAASRMVTAIDEALDVLINRTGLVGR